MPKRLPVLLAVIVCPIWAFTQLSIWVTPTGNANNNGSKSAPFATIKQACTYVQLLKNKNSPRLNKGATIILASGTYPILQPLLFTSKDNGTDTFPLVIQAAPNAKPIISGGIQIKHWEKLHQNIPGLPASVQGKIWVASVPHIQKKAFSFRQLWVNDQKAIRAKNTPGDIMLRIIAWNKADASCWIPTPTMQNLQQYDGLEMFIHQWWAIAQLRIAKMEVHGDSTKLFFKAPESKIQNEHPWPAPWISKETGNSAFYLVNSIQFLDTPGEWYLDEKKQLLYYYPLPGEQMSSAKVIAPFLESLVQIKGTIAEPVKNIQFKDIEFQYAGWLSPSIKGNVPHQLGMNMTLAYKLKPVGTKENPMLDNQAWIERPGAAVYLNYADHIQFSQCRFEHLASTGIDNHQFVHGNSFVGNVFKDIGGNGILSGVYSAPDKEIHERYQPSNDKEVCDSTLIANNFITNIGNEDWSCAGIGLGYTSNSIVSHNELENLPYSGISMGWGWNPAVSPMRNNKIIGNKITHYGKHNYDCAGIYTLSAQPNSEISENLIDSIYKAPYAHLPSHWFYLYTDQGSSYITVKNNWTPSTKYLQNANGPGNVWINNGPIVSDQIKKAAGVSTTYQYLRKESTRNQITIPINEEHKEVIELVFKQDKPFELSKLKMLLFNNQIDSNALYQWKNHVVIFDKVKDITVLEGRLKNNFPNTTVHVFHDLFYEYSKKKHCSDTTIAPEWDHILLTANLVADPVLQQEYLNHHATQFEKWKEVSNGFCNAQFQQLLIFKNGRQLVLIISIPKGQSLDELNPRTTLHNPRVNDWNEMMKKYQEGIEGTAKGETWVFLNPVNK
jgi:hypothetical protein